MTEDIRPIHRQRDNVIVSTFLKLVDEQGFRFETLYVGGLGSALPDDSGNALYDYILESRFYSLSILAVAKGDFKIKYSRTKPNTQEDISVDYITFTLSNETGQHRGKSFDKLTDADRIRAVSTLLGRLENPRLADEIQLTPDPLRARIQVSERILDSLEALHERISTQLVDREKDLFAKGIEIERELRESALRSRQVLQEEFESKNKELIERELALKEEYSAYDDRNYKLVRRDNFGKITQRFNELASRPQVSWSVSRKRIPVHLTVWAALFSLSFGIWWFSEFSTITNVGLYPYILLIKPTLLGISALILLTWYLRWMGHWSDHNASAEMEIRMYELDILRANWLVETSLEWPSVADKDMPEGLLAGMSNGLFSRRGGSTGLDGSPADHLASALLGSASKLKLNIGGNEIEFDKSGLKAAKKDSAGKKVDKDE